MKKRLPEPRALYAEVSAMSYEAVKWELLKTAIGLKVFDLLQDPATSRDVAARLSTHATNTEFFLKALSSLGWLSFEKGAYRNTALADLYLADGKDTSIGSFLLFMGEWTGGLLNGGLLDLVRNGPRATGDIGGEEVWEHGARATLNYSRCGRAQRLARIVADLPEFPAFSRMLDMGVGPGIMGIAVVAEHPTLEGVLFDRKAVAGVADEVIREYGLEKRVTVLCGDYMCDPIGRNYDLVMANFTLNFYRDRLDEIVSKVHDALDPGGVFLVTNDALDKDRIFPTDSLMSWLPTCLQRDGMMFDPGEIATAMLRAGFVSTQSRVVDDPAMTGAWAGRDHRRQKSEDIAVDPRPRKDGGARGGPEDARLFLLPAAIPAIGRHPEAGAAEPPMRCRALKRQPLSIVSGTSMMPTLSAASRGVAGVLFAALVANAAGHSFVLVVMPGLARRLGFSDLQTGVMIGLSALVVTLTAPAWGRVGDRAGRRRPFIAALVGGAAFLGFAAFLVSLRLRQGIDARTAFILLFAARVLQSCLAGGLVPATQAIVADITAADRRAGGLGVMGAAFGIGSILGGVIAWRLAADAPVPALALLAAVIAVAAAVSAVLLPETRDGASAASGMGIGLARTIFRYLAVTLLSTATYATLQQVTVLRLEDGFRLAHDVAMRTGSAVMMTSMAAMVLGLLFLVPLLPWPPRRLCLSGAAGAAASLLVAAMTTALPVLFAAMAGFGLFLSPLTPDNAAQISLRAPGAQASAGGINAVAKGLGMAVGPIAGAALHQISPRAPYIAAALALLCCAAMIWPASEPRADRPARSGGQPQVE